MVTKANRPGYRGVRSNGKANAPCSRKRISTSTSQSQGEREGGWPEAQDQSHLPAAKQHKMKTSIKKEEEGFMRKAMALNFFKLFYFRIRFLDGMATVSSSKHREQGLYASTPFCYVGRSASFACHL